MANPFQKAKKEKVWTKVLMGGPSGSGKTYSALRMAAGLARSCGSRVATIDTEAGRLNYYAEEFDFDGIQLEEFTPEAYVDIENGGVLTTTGRGSAVSWITNKLLGFTEVDRIAASVKMYPDRFMSAARILQSGSLPDRPKGPVALYGNVYGKPRISGKPLQAAAAKHNRKESAVSPITTVRQQGRRLGDPERQPYVSESSYGKLATTTNGHPSGMMV